MPSPVEALPCGSRSTISTRSPIAANAVPRFIAVVVLPTPPFWLASAKMRGWPGAMVCCGRFAPPDMIEFNDPAMSAGAAGVEMRFDIPIFSGFGQFSLYILALKKQRFCTPFHQRLREADELM